MSKMGNKLRVAADRADALSVKSGESVEKLKESSKSGGKKALFLAANAWMFFREPGKFVDKLAKEQTGESDSKEDDECTPEELPPPEECE